MGVPGECCAVNRFIVLFFQMSIMALSHAGVYNADLAVEAFKWIFIAAAALFLIALVLSALGGSFPFFGYYSF